MSTSFAPQFWRLFNLKGWQYCYAIYHRVSVFNQPKGMNTWTLMLEDKHGSRDHTLHPYLSIQPALSLKASYLQGDRC